ncbi:MAG TPA: hypothetical protein VN857_09355, partial [Chthoniobacterales bacterium]|nr:hypothetical protein [Chthoniobacterales bacterium]
GFISTIRRLWKPAFSVLLISVYFGTCISAGNAYKKALGDTQSVPFSPDIFQQDCSFSPY